MPELSDAKVADAVAQEAELLEDFHLVKFDPETLTQAVKKASSKYDGAYLPSEVEVLLDLAAAKRRLDHRETDQTTLDLETEMRETFRAYHSLLNWGKFEKSANQLAHFNVLKIARLKIGALPVVWPEDLGNAT